MQLHASWRVVGVITERRELKSEKNASWRGYVCKVATYGLAAEITLNATLFAQVGDGEHVEFFGRFEDQKGFLKLVAERVNKPSSAAPAAGGGR